MVLPILKNIVHYTFEGTPYATDRIDWVWYDGVEGPELTNELELPNGDTS